MPKEQVEDKSHKVITRKLVGRSLSVRKNEQTVNFPLLVSSVVLLIGVPVLWVHLITARVSGSQSDYAVRATQRANGTVSYEDNIWVTGTPFSWQAPGLQSGQVGPTITMLPSFVTSTMPFTVTPLPTLTPLPTSTPFIYVAAYSYYNPALGGVNCHDSNWTGTECLDETASGISWRDNVGRAVAVPPRWLEYLGYGTVIRVISPSVLVGDYLVLDLCNGCSGDYWPDGVERLDFLDTRQRLPWASRLEFYVLDFVAP